MQDISIKNISISINGKNLLRDTDLVVAQKHRYGLVGKNGCGKSTLLDHIANRRLNGLESIRDIYLVSQELEMSNESVFDIVLRSNKILFDALNERKEIENKLKENESSDDYDDDYNDVLLEQYKKFNDKIVNDLDYFVQESKIKKILHGLGISHSQNASTFSGGWKMRISLACALYNEPMLLLLDEPTNHLDLEACLWLVEYLKGYRNTIIFVSHDIDVLNDICTDIINFDNMKLRYYTGGYYKFMKQLDQEIKQNQKICDKIDKTVEQLKKKNKTEKDEHKKKSTFEHDEYIRKNPKPYIPYSKKIHIDFGTNVVDDSRNLLDLYGVSFAYDKVVLDNVSLGLNINSRLCIVGKNGSGKTTLLKILSESLKPTDGYVRKDNKTRISYFEQHIFELLPCDKTPCEYLSCKYGLDESDVRMMLGKIGLEGSRHRIPIGDLSGGQKVRVSLVELQIQQPHVLIMDEPTNHIDLDTIEALKNAINKFSGAVVITTHNVDFIESINCETYEIENAKLNKTEFDVYCNKILNELDND